MINLPQGLFIIKGPSNIGISNINDLIYINSQLKRKVDILTDLNIDDSLFDNIWVRKIDSPILKYDYIFIADTFENISTQYRYIQFYKKENSWLGYMIPISNISILYNQAIQYKNSIQNIGYNAAIIPTVSSHIGGDMFIIFNGKNILSQPDSGQHQFIWGNIFRSCGYFGTNAKWIDYELLS